MKWKLLPADRTVWQRCDVYNVIDIIINSRLNILYSNFEICRVEHYILILCNISKYNLYYYMVYFTSCLPYHSWAAFIELISETNKVLGLHFKVPQQWQPMVRDTHSDMLTVCMCVCVCVLGAILWHCCCQASVQGLLRCDGGLQTLINKCDTGCTGCQTGAWLAQGGAVARTGLGLMCWAWPCIYSCVKF